MRQEVDVFKTQVSMLRTLVSQFSALCGDEIVMEKYFAIQNYDSLIYDPIVSMEETEYRNNLFNRLPEVLNAVNNSFGKIYDELFLRMQSHIKKKRKKMSKEIQAHLEKIEQELQIAIRLKDVKTEQLLRMNIEYLENLDEQKIVDVTPMLHKLDELGLQKDPYKEAVKLIKQIGKVPMMIKFLHPGEIIIRARPIERGQSSFSKTTELSFKPQEFNKTYQRASTPYRTMFYGSFTDEKKENYTLSENRFTGTLESMRWLVDETTNRKQRIAYGRWDVTSTLKLAVILGEKDKKSKNPIMLEMYEEFQKFISWLPEQIKKNAVAIADFFSRKFSDPTPDADKHYLYMLSAMWAEACVDAGADGVFYPSVRTEGDGICVAITPDSCKKLNLSVAGEGIIYKKAKHVLMNNELFSIVQNGETTFKMVPVDPAWKATPSQILEKLQTDSIDDLEDWL
ncbi:MAG: hypothetical protein IPF81_14630 [Bacteroidetes bacterium]|nr:hypothetical protein [Bacteroidota bacterium]